MNNVPQIVKKFLRKNRPITISEIEQIVHETAERNYCVAPCQLVGNDRLWTQPVIENRGVGEKETRLFMDKLIDEFKKAKISERLIIYLKRNVIKLRDSYEVEVSYQIWIGPIF